MLQVIQEGSAGEADSGLCVQGLCVPDGDDCPCQAARLFHWRGQHTFPSSKVLIVAHLISSADLLFSKAHHIHPSVHPSVLLAQVAQIEVSGPRIPISYLWTPWMSTTRHTKIISLHPYF